MKKFVLPSIFAAIFVLGLLSPCALAQRGGEPFNKMIGVHSGQVVQAAMHQSSHMQGPIPYSIKPLTNPTHGKIIIKRDSSSTKIFYQSKPGFVGQDSFQYVRVSNDKFAGTYAVAVTVK